MALCVSSNVEQETYFPDFLVLFWKFHKIMKSAGEESTIINIFKYPGLRDLKHSWKECILLKLMIKFNFNVKCVNL